MQVHGGDQSPLPPLWNSFVGTGIHNGPVPPANLMLKQEKREQPKEVLHLCRRSTHTHLTLANHASSDIVHRMFSCNAFDTYRHPQTDDALHKHNFAPDECILCYGNTRCEQKQLQLTICFSFGWRECMFYPCLVQTIMFGNMSTHVDTNRQNSPKSIKR